MTAAHDGLASRLRWITESLDQNSSLEQRCTLIRGSFNIPFTASDLSDVFDLAVAGRSLDRNQAVTAAAAAIVHLRERNETAVITRQFIEEAFVPLVAALDSTRTGHALADAVAEIIRKHGHWAEGQKIVGMSASALEQASGLRQKGAIAPHKHSESTSSTASSTSASGVEIPPAAASYLCCALINRALFVNNETPSAAALSSSKSSSPAVAAAIGVSHIDKLQAQFLEVAAITLLPLALQLLSCEDPTCRRLALQQLLPCLHQAHAKLQHPAEQSFRDAVWQQCMTLLPQPGISRRMALATLLHFQHLWNLQPPVATTTPVPSSSSSSSGAMIASDTQSAPSVTPTAASNSHAVHAITPQPISSPEISSSSSSSRSVLFWSLVRDCLADEEPLNRKRALKLLQLHLSPQLLAATPVWGMFLTLFELLDEFAAHLLKATWHLVSLMVFCQVSC